MKPDIDITIGIVENIVCRCAKKVSVLSILNRANEMYLSPYFSALG